MLCQLKSFKIVQYNEDNLFWPDVVTLFASCMQQASKTESVSIQYKNIEKHIAELSSDPYQVKRCR